MSLQEGMAALNLEMPNRVPRTEYSIEMHWDAITKITGIAVDTDSSPELKQKARIKLYEQWNYGLSWNILINNSFLGKYYTDMGHAVYEKDGVDYHEVGKAVFEDVEDVYSFDPVEALPFYEKSELIRLFDKNYDDRCILCPDAVNMTGTYITCVSGLIDMLGWDMLLMAAGYDLKAFGEMTRRYMKWMTGFYEALVECKSQVIMVHDDITWTSGAFMAPSWYREFVFPEYKRLFAPLKEAGKKILFTSDGTYTEFIDDIAQTGVSGFVMEPTTDMAYIAEKYGKTHSFVGNADTRILLSGSREEIEAEVKRCMDIGKKCPGYFLSVGNHIPPNTPVDSLLWYNECYERYSRR